MSGVEELQDTAEQAANSDGAEWWARAGFVARGYVYLNVGVIALQIAWAVRADTEASKDGALRAIAEQPFAGVLLTVLAVALAGYALWRFSEALWGKRDETDEHKRTLKRLGSAAKGLIYVGFLLSTVRFIGGGADSGGKGGGQESEESWTATLLDLPGGRWWVGAAALALFGLAGWLMYRGLAQKYEKRLDTHEMGPVTGRVVDVVGVIGLTARGAIVGFAGYLLLRAALEYDPDEAAGVDGTLRELAEQPYGQVILTVLGVGIACYGLYSWVEARYRRL
ncbi:MAG: DUF1206 domain-containing protein [Actinomycetota bacterium]